MFESRPLNDKLLQFILLEVRGPKGLINTCWLLGKREHLVQNIWWGFQAHVPSKAEIELPIQYKVEAL